MDFSHDDVIIKALQYDRYKVFMENFTERKNFISAYENHFNDGVNMSGIDYIAGVKSDMDEHVFAVAEYFETISKYDKCDLILQTFAGREDSLISAFIKHGDGTVLSYLDYNFGEDIENNFNIFDNEYLN